MLNSCSSLNKIIRPKKLGIKKIKVIVKSFILNDDFVYPYFSYNKKPTVWIKSNILRISNL